MVKKTILLDVSRFVTDHKFVVGHSGECGGEPVESPVRKRHLDSISSAEEQRLWVCDIIAQRLSPISVCDI